MTLFKEIYADIKRKIENGVYKKGGVLPNEGELQKIYQVSRTTVRKAVEQLVEEKQVVRKKGVGLFVAPGISKQNILDMTGIIKTSTGLEPEKTQIKESYLRKAGVYYSKIFGIEENELIYYLSFLVFSEGERTYEKLILPLDYFPGFDPEILKVTAIIEAVNTGKMSVQDVYQDFQLTEATDEDCKQLEVATDFPVFKITNTFLDDRARVVAIEYKLQSALDTKYSIDFD